jgi:PIN domain nuclease of toxin-antitoxin system
MAISAPASLSVTARREIEDLQNEMIVSTASLWEMAIKLGVGKLQFSSAYETFIPQIYFAPVNPEKSC